MLMNKFEFKLIYKKHRFKNKKYKTKKFINKKMKPSSRLNLKSKLTCMNEKHKNE